MREGLNPGLSLFLSVAGVLLHAQRGGEHKSGRQVEQSYIPLFLSSHHSRQNSAFSAADMDLFMPL